MMTRAVRICCASVFVFLLFCGTSFSMTEEEAARQWDAVRGTAEESAVLMNLFRNGKIPGNFLHTVKERFYEIAQPEDAAVLLDTWIKPNAKRRMFALTLLRGLKGDEFTELFEKYLYLASDLEIQYQLYNLMAQQNSLPAFRAAVKLINYTQEQGEHRQAIFYLHAMSRFKDPDIRQEIINETKSSSSITRAACYNALRNYPDDEVLEIIDKALSSDTGYIPGEEKRFIAERHIKSGKAGKGFIKDILNATKRAIQIEIKFKKEYLPKQKNSSMLPDEFERAVLSASLEASVSSGSSDAELAAEYAPQILLSYGGPPAVYLRDYRYPYTDYIPMYVNNVTRLYDKTVYIHLAGELTYNGRTYSPGNELLDTLNYIGDPLFRSSDNYLDFSPAWGGGLDDEVIENGYKSLETIFPTVNYRVFKDPTQTHPIAVQYWFFYYYNDWFVFDHQGDWETITVFLNADAQPVEVIFSTHYEANRYSWEFVGIAYNFHPKVYVSNGGHGSYNQAGETEYADPDTGLWLTDNHQGDQEVLNPEDYYLLPLIAEEAKDASWIRFEGRWGADNSSPEGPRLRTDAPTNDDWERAKHKPCDPAKHCEPRYAAKIYGDDDIAL